MCEKGKYYQEEYILVYVVFVYSSSLFVTLGRTRKHEELV